jgi:hypothetical protein
MPPVADVFSVRAVFTSSGKIDQGVRWFYLYSGGPPTSANLASWGTLIANSMNGDFAAITPSNVQWNELVLTDLGSNTGAAATVQLAVPAGTEALAPPDECTVTSYTLDVRYRGGHPRTYWPFSAGSSINPGGTWPTTFTTAVQNAVSAAIAAPIAAQEGSATCTNHVAVSYYSGFTSVENPITHRYRNVPTLRPTPLTHNVVGMIVQPYVGSQRRRRQMA